MYINVDVLSSHNMIYAVFCGNGMRASIFGKGGVNVTTEHRGNVRTLIEEAAGGPAEEEEDDLGL